MTREQRRDAELEGGASLRERGDGAGPPEDPEDKLDPDGPVTSLDDMRVSRDRDGRLEPRKVETLWEGNVIRFLPMTYGDRNKYRLDVRGVTELDDEERAEFLSEHLLDEDGDLVDLSAEDLQDFGWTTIDDVLNTIGFFSRDRRRDRLPRPVPDDGGKADPGA